MEHKAEQPPGGTIGFSAEQALENIPTNAGALLRILQDAALQGQVLEVEGRSFIYNTGCGYFEEVQPKREPEREFGVSQISSISRIVHAYGGEHTWISVGEHCITADLNVMDPDVNWQVRLNTYRDPLITTSVMTLPQLISHLERLGSSVEFGDDLLETLRLVKVSDTSETQIEEQGAHTVIRQKSERQIHGSRDGAPVSIPKVIVANVPFGTLGNFERAIIRVRAGVKGDGILFNLEPLNLDEMVYEWINRTVDELEGLLDDIPLAECPHVFAGPVDG